jgi:hypothetical protein
MQFLSLQNSGTFRTPYSVHQLYAIAIQVALQMFAFLNLTQPSEVGISSSISQMTKLSSKKLSH